MIYYLTDEFSKDTCPFSILLITASEIRNPKIHLKLVTTSATVIVDMNAKLPIGCLPISSEVCRVVPKFGEVIYSDDILNKLLQIYPQHAADLRRCYAFGEEAFADFLHGMDELNMWTNTVNAYFGGV